MIIDFELKSTTGERDHIESIKNLFRKIKDVAQMEKFLLSADSSVSVGGRVLLLLQKLKPAQRNLRKESESKKREYYCWF